MMPGGTSPKARSAGAGDVGHCLGFAVVFVGKGKEKPSRSGEGWVVVGAVYSKTGSLGLKGTKSLIESIIRCLVPFKGKLQKIEE